MLIIQNSTIFTPQTMIEQGTVLIEKGRIQAVGNKREVALPPGVPVIDGQGQFLVPGFIDLQVNGGFGHDFTADPSTIWLAAAQLPRYGVTSFLPTIITSPRETMAQAQSVMGMPPTDFVGAAPLDLHLEGPFIHPEKKGAHHPAYIRPSVPPPTTVDWSPQTGVALVTLAPELPGALPMITALVERGVVVSAGHTMATYEAALAGIEAGIRYGTHLFNAMPPLHHRQPGALAALLIDERVVPGLIADGVHVHPAVVKIVWQVTNGRLNLVTDAMTALGMPPGAYQVGEQPVQVTATDARLPDGTLAGSILSLDAALRNLIAFTGCALADALATLTTIPAALLGLSDRKGQIAPGFDADLVLLTPDLRVSGTIVGGRVVFGL